MNSINAVLRRAIWDVDVASLPAWKARLTRVLRVAWAVVRDVVEGQITLRAMSLVYTTLLSLVPLLAVSFSVLKSFGVHNQVEPLLAKFLLPLGEKGAEISAQIIGFVENIRVGLLGSLGLALLFYTVVSLIQKIERSFNFIWHAAHTRSLGQRFSNYLSVILVGPVLMFMALGITASVASTAVVQRLIEIEPLGTAFAWLGQLVPYLLVIGAFTFVYGFVPNTRVRPASALTGGVVAGVLWETAGWAFASFVASSTRYAAIYSGFAVLVVFMVWIYVSWLVLLIGASISFYHQHPEYLAARRQELSLSARFVERVALLVMFLIGRDHYRERPSWTLEGLSRRLSIPLDVLARVVGPLERSGFLVETGADPPAYLPARALETVRVKEVLDAVRSADESGYLSPERVPSEAAVDRLLEHVDQAVDKALEDQTLKELAKLSSGS